MTTQQAITTLEGFGIHLTALENADMETTVAAVSDIDYGDGLHLTDEQLQEVSDCLEALAIPSRSDLWDRLPAETEVKILDENGVNVENGAMRPLPDGTWLYVDDVNGFDRISAENARRLAGVTSA